MAIRNDPRRVPKNTRLKQKKTAKLLNVPLPPRHPEHPSVKRLMHEYRYERRLDLDTHTLGVLFEMRQSERPGNWVHQCPNLGTAATGKMQHGNVTVVVCKHHLHKPPGRWLQPYGQLAVGALWLKQFYPTEYAVWRKRMYSKENAPSSRSTYGYDKVRLKNEEHKYQRIVSLIILPEEPCVAG